MKVYKRNYVLFAAIHASFVLTVFLIVYGIGLLRGIRPNSGFEYIIMGLVVLVPLLSFLRRFMRTAARFVSRIELTPDSLTLYYLSGDQNSIPWREIRSLDIASTTIWGFPGASYGPQWFRFRSYYRLIASRTYFMDDMNWYSGFLHSQELVKDIVHHAKLKEAQPPRRTGIETVEKVWQK